jgi:cell division protein FtsW
MRTQVKSMHASVKPLRAYGYRFAGFDTWLFMAALALAALGLVMITSASVEYADQRFQQPLFYFYRHCVYLVISGVAAVAAFRVPVSWWSTYAVHVLFGSFFLLVIIWIPGLGHTANNATRWLALGPFTLQVSELAKIGVVVYLASYLVRQSELVKSHWLGFMNPMIVMGLLIFLLLLQPDFGAVVVFLVAALSLLFLGGVRIWQFSALIVLCGSILAIMVLSEEYRMARMVAFLDPWTYQQGGGYQLVQSLIAFGRGEFFGLGIGNSIQKLFFLPEAHTDFIFAVLAEELGLFGCIATLCLYAFLIIRILRVAYRAERIGQLFGAYVTYGVALIFSIQLFINVGVNIGLLPTKGLTLPFLSYGGSSLLASGIFIAMVLRIDQEVIYAASDEDERRGTITSTNRLVDSAMNRVLGSHEHGERYG